MSDLITMWGGWGLLQLAVSIFHHSSQLAAISAYNYTTFRTIHWKWEVSFHTLCSLVIALLALLVLAYNSFWFCHVQKWSINQVTIHGSFILSDIYCIKQGQISSKKSNCNLKLSFHTFIQLCWKSWYLQFHSQVFPNKRKWLNMKPRGICSPL